MRWKVLHISPVDAKVALGPIRFTVDIIQKNDKIVVIKPISFYLDPNVHKEMIQTVARAYRDAGY